MGCSPAAPGGPRHCQTPPSTFAPPRRPPIPGLPLEGGSPARRRGGVIALSLCSVLTKATKRTIVSDGTDGPDSPKRTEQTMHDDIPPLSPEQQRFVESVGLYFEQYQLSRIGGRLLGLLTLLGGPLTLDQMAGALG